jgi:exonuclease SbcD
VRVLLFSDVHLDAPFTWAAPVIARRRRQAIRDALTRAVRLAATEHVDAVLCGGDLFEHERVSPDTGQFLRTLFERIHPIPVFLAPGNHDWLSPESLYRRVQWTPNVHLFEESCLTAKPLMDGLTLWSAAHHAPAGTANFLARFRVDRGGVHVALFHGSENAFLSQEGGGKQPHAPFHVEELEASGLHFAFLGHFHTPRDHSRFVYPGNPEPLTFGEAGERGVVIATIQSHGGVLLERHRVAATQIHDLEVDLTSCVSQQDVRDRVAAALADRSGYARLTLRGELGPEVDLHDVDFSVLPTSLDAPPIIRFSGVTVGYDLDRIAEEPTVRGQFVRDVREAAHLTEDERWRVVVTGLRALDGRDDLEVV